MTFMLPNHPQLRGPEVASNTCCTVLRQDPQVAFWRAPTSDPIALFTAILTIATIGLWVSTSLLWLTTKKLAKATKDGGDTQAEKMERSATAMERVAGSMETNARKVSESVEHQRTFGMTQMRAYVTVAIGNGFYQDDNHVFEADPLVINKGFTTARRLHWRIACDILPIPVPADFKFPLPKEVCGGSDLDGQLDGIMRTVLRDERGNPRKLPPDEAEAAKWGKDRALTLWGYIAYTDVFGLRHRRTFAQQVWWTQVGEKRPDGTYPLQIRGVHMQRHNRGN